MTFWNFLRKCQHYYLNISQTIHNLFIDDAHSNGMSLIIFWTRKLGPERSFWRKLTFDDVSPYFETSCESQDCTLFEKTKLYLHRRLFLFQLKLLSFTGSLGKYKIKIAFIVLASIGYHISKLFNGCKETRREKTPWRTKIWGCRSVCGLLNIHNLAGTEKFTGVDRPYSLVRPVQKSVNLLVYCIVHLIL